MEEKKLLNNNLSIIFKKTLNKCLLFFTLIFFTPSLFASNFYFSSLHKTAYQQIFSFQTPLATQTLKKISPSNGISLYLQNLNTGIPILLNGSQKEYEKWLDDYDSRLDKVQDLDKNSPYYRFIEAEMRLQAAYLKFYFGDRISCFLHFRQAYKLLEDNHKKYPNFLPAKKTLGLLNVILGSVPNEYAWLMNGLGFHGNVQIGLNYLNEVKNSSSLYSFEADFFLVMIKMYILKQEKEISHHVKKLYKNHSENLLIQFIYSSYFHQIGKNEKVLDALLSRPIGEKYTSFPYLSIMLGNAYLQKGLYKEAAPYYHAFLQKNKGKNYLKQAYYRLFIVYQLSGDTKQAQIYLQKCKENGQTILEADRFANRFANKDRIPDNSLIKARLMVDGGYYQEALNCLMDANFYTERTDQLEFYYRKARIFHKMEKINQAITAYKKLILLSKPEDNSYFAPNSCLQLAYIYRIQHKNDLVRYYFEKALTYDEHEYKDSIDNKAKAGLNQLSE